MRAVFKREITAYFHSPIAYMIIGFFSLLVGVFFVPTIMSGNASFDSVLASAGFMLVFIIPILTMRIMSEDRKNGTEVLLITSPTKLWGIILGKYFASIVVFLIVTGITCLYALVLGMFGGLLDVQLLGGYIGFLFLGSSMLAIGLFVSSLTENQIIAAVISFAIFLVFWLVDLVASSIGGIVASVLKWFSILSRYDDFSAGILNVGNIIFYVSMIFLFLFFTERNLERRRWSEG